MSITLHAICAVDGNDKLLGWSAVAFQREGEAVSYMEFGQYRDRESAQERLDEIVQYIDDWELVSGVRYTLEKTLSFFAINEALSDQWQKLSPRIAAEIERDEFSLFFLNGNGFRPDLTFEERIQWNAPGVPQLCGPKAVAQAAAYALEELAAELGHPLTEVEALTLAKGWGESKMLQEVWSIEIVPAVGNAGEEVSFSIVSLLHGMDHQLTTICDLSEPIPFERHARMAAAKYRVDLNLLSKIPYVLVHRDGTRHYLDQVRKLEQIADAWPPFQLERIDLPLFLSWGMPLMRGSMILEGSIDARRTTGMA